MEHEIILDLLPLYHDGVCSDASRAAVEAHLKDCPDCRAALAAMDAPLPVEPVSAPDDEAAVKSLSRAWEKGKRRAWWKGALIAAAVCAVLAGGLWFLTTWTVIPVSSEDYTLEVYRLESGSVGIHWNFREGKETWYALEFREEEDGLHYYLERPVLRRGLFNVNHNYNRSGDILLRDWLDDAIETRAVYFGLGKDAVLLWQEGEEVDFLPATAAQEEMWAVAELSPRAVP